MYLLERPFKVRGPFTFAFVTDGFKRPSFITFLLFFHFFSSQELPCKA